MIGNMDELSNREGNPRPAKVNEYNSISRECMCINYRLRFRTDIYIYIYKEKTARIIFARSRLFLVHEKVNVIRDVESWNYFVVIIGYIFVVNCCDYKIYTTTIR